MFFVFRANPEGVALGERLHTFDRLDAEEVQSCFEYFRRESGQCEAACAQCVGFCFEYRAVFVEAHERTGQLEQVVTQQAWQGGGGD